MLFLQTIFVTLIFEQEQIMSYNKADYFPFATPHSTIYTIILI